MAVPQRTCIGCHHVKAKKELIRIVRLSKGEAVVIDLRGKEKGRGAYVCPNVNCISKAMQPKRLDRAFRVIPNPSDRGTSLEVVDKLKQDLLELIEVNRC